MNEPRSHHFPDIISWKLDSQKNPRLGQKLRRRHRNITHKVRDPQNGEVPDLMKRARKIEARLRQLAGQDAFYDPLDDFVPGQHCDAIGYGHHYEDLPRDEELTHLREEIRAEFVAISREKSEQAKEGMAHSQDFLEEYESVYGSY